MKVLTSLFVWLFIVVTCIINFFIALTIFLLTVLFDRNRVILHAFSCFWARIYIAVNPYWSLKVEGRNKIDSSRPWVLVSNHQSFIDILILFSLFKQYKWVSRKVMFKIPFLGWNMTLNDYIAVKRSSVKSQHQMMKKSRMYLSQGSSILIFPEGTRSHTGVLQKFKDGAFRLAKDAQVGIIPIVLDGSFDALPRGGLFMKKASRFRLKILDPLPAADIQTMAVKDISQQVHSQMEQALTALRKEG